MLVIAEQRGGVVNRASWETVAAAQQVGGDVAIALLGASIDNAAAELAAAESAGVIVVDDPALGSYSADGYVQGVERLLAAEGPTHVFFPHTYQTRDFAPALAARIGRPLVTDVTAIKKDGDSRKHARPSISRRRSGSSPPGAGSRRRRTSRWSRSSHGRSAPRSRRRARSAMPAGCPWTVR
jgi:electron transfer flavoprotein alpha subunit